MAHFVLLKHIWEIISTSADISKNSIISTAQQHNSSTATVKFEYAHTMRRMIRSHNPNKPQLFIVNESILVCDQIEPSRAEPSQFNQDNTTCLLARLKKKVKKKHTLNFSYIERFNCGKLKVCFGK